MIGISFHCDAGPEARSLGFAFVSNAQEPEATISTVPRSGHTAPLSLTCLGFGGEGEAEASSSAALSPILTDTARQSRSRCKKCTEPETRPTTSPSLAAHAPAQPPAALQKMKCCRGLGQSRQSPAGPGRARKKIRPHQTEPGALAPDRRPALARRASARERRTRPGSMRRLLHH